MCVNVVVMSRYFASHAQFRCNQASTNLKKFLSLKIDKFTLINHSLVSCRNLGNQCKHALFFFFFLLKQTF